MVKLETERLILRNILQSDAQDMYEYSKDEIVGLNAGWEYHKSIDDTKEILKTVFLNQPHVFGIILKDTNKLIGSIGLIKDPKRSFNNAMMLGYALGKDYWGNGYMTEASQCVIKYGFESINLDLISVYCYPYNKASQRVIEKCGFIYEGTLHMSELRYDGTILDDVCYSLSKDAYFKSK